MHPPGHGYEDDKGLHTPAGASIGDDDHCHVDSVRLGVDCVEDPEGLAREGLAARLLSEFARLRGPEEVEHRVEIGEGAGDVKRDLEDGIIRVIFEVPEVLKAGLREGAFDDRQGDGDGEP